jgi:hypothetical protein
MQDRTINNDRFGTCGRVPSPGFKKKCRASRQASSASPYHPSRAVEESTSRKTEKKTIDTNRKNPELFVFKTGSGQAGQLLDSGGEKASSSDISGKSP